MVSVPMMVRMSGGRYTHAHIQGLPLTTREHDVLRMYALCGDQSMVAHELGVSTHHVRNTLSDVYAKLGCTSAIGAFRLMGWLRP